MLFALSFAAHAEPEARTETLEIRGQPRSALVYTPTVEAGSSKPRVVVAYHGLGGDGAGLVASWLPLAEKQGVLLVVPLTPKVEGWYAGEPPDFRALDVELFTAWKAWAVAQGGDADRVYATGFSMGAHFTAALVCRGVELAGAGIVGMSMVEAMEQGCAGNPTPIAYIASEQDRFASPGPLQIRRVQVALTSQEQTRARFGAIDGCEAPGKPKVSKNTKIWEPTCAGAPFLAAQVPGAVHAYRPRGFDTVGVLWDFWMRNERRVDPKPE